MAFSSTFSSENPIELPTATSANSELVVDTRGGVIDTRQSYRIASSLGGVLSGDVFLGASPNSAAPCPDGIFKYNNDGGTRNTPVRFIPYTSMGRPNNIYENQDINIQFTTSNCADYTIWKVGDYDASLEASLLGTTGGTIGQQGSSWFKIVKEQDGYQLLYCPGPFVCPNCSLDQCQVVWVIMQNGKMRLALATEQNPPQELRFPLSVYFVLV